MRQNCTIIGTVNLTDETLKDLTGARSVRAIALKIGMEPSTLGRQVQSGISAETLIAIARAYNLSPIHVLIRYGFLTEAELARAAMDISLDVITDEELAEEILRRVRNYNASPALTNELGENERITRDQAAELLKQEEHALAADERDGRDVEQTADPHA